jgi:hypothetical protein
MQSDTALLATSTAACARLGCREPRVLHAWFFDFPPQKLPFCASRARTREPVLPAIMKIRVSSYTNNPAGSTKTLLHEMDLKVAELVLSGVAKGLEEGGAMNIVTGDCPAGFSGAEASDQSGNPDAELGSRREANDQARRCRTCGKRRAARSFPSPHSAACSMRYRSD